MARRQWSWFFVVVLVFISLRWEGRELGVDGWGRYAPAAGLAVGAVWQLVDRRDLADRLLVPAFVFAAGALLTAVAPQGARTTVTGLLAGAAVVAGLVLVEQCFRRRGKAVVDAPDMAAASPPPHVE